MGPVSKIAGRYLFARKSNDVITWISRISVLGIAIGTVALIAVMSVFNGFTSLIEANLDANSPDYRIVSETSKTFALDEQQANALSQIAGLSEMQAVIEDMVVLKYGDVQGVVKIKALQGAYSYSISSTAARHFGISTSFLTPLELYYPRTDVKISLTNPALKMVKGRPTSILNEQEELVVLPIEQARELLSLEEGQMSSLNIYCHEADVKPSSKEIKKVLGEGFEVQDRYQQFSQLYKMMRYEKLAVYLILFFIILVVAVNIYASLYMLIMEKQQDIIHLRAMGASKALVRKIFRSEGMLVCGIGLAVGLIIGVLLVYAQGRWGLVRMPGNTLAGGCYPVSLKLQDLLLSTVGVALIGVVISNLSTKKI